MRPRASRIDRLVAASTLLGLSSCEHAAIAPGTPSRLGTGPDPIELTERGALRVGVAEVDVTPPRGLALGASSTGAGLRPRCRVFYFQYDAGRGRAPQALAIVPCEIGAPSWLLERRVAERARRLTPLGADRIVIAASGARGSLVLPPGEVDREGDGGEALVDFLAGRIANAIARAHDDAVRERDDLGCVAWIASSVRGRRDRRAPAFGRNASVGDFLGNHLTREEETLFGAASRDPSRATDGRVAVLRVDRCDRDGKSTRQLGALALVDVDPSSATSANDGVDLFGVAAREAVEGRLDRERCEREPPRAARGSSEEGSASAKGVTRAALSDGDGCFVVGVVQGVAGDVVPATDGEGPRETRRLGVALGQEILRLQRLAEPLLVRDAPMRVAYRELSLPGALVEASTPFWAPFRRDVYAAPGVASRCGAVVPLDARSGEPPGPCEPRLCDEPAVADVDGGARPLLDPISTDCQAPKVVRPRRFAEAPSELPRRAPLRAIYLADRVVTTLPAQVTTIAGHRVERQIEAWLTAKSRDDLGAALTLSRASADVGAIATEDEHAAQTHEAQRMLYGPSTARFFANQALCLTRTLLEPVDVRADAECALGQPDPGVLDDMRFVVERGEPVVAACDPEGGGRFLVASEPDARAPREAPRSHCGVDLRRVLVDGQEAYVGRWIPPRRCAAPLVAPRVRVVDASRSDRVIASDDGSSFEVRRDEDAWRITWAPGARESSRLLDRPFRLEVSIASPSGPHVERSESFDPLCR